MGLFWAKYARRIFAIVSNTSIPNLAPVSPTEATVDPPSRGSRLDADHPENGVLIPCRSTRLAVGLVQPVVSAEGVGLEDPGIVGQMRLSMLAGPIARVVEHRRWRIRPAERTIVAHINPTSPGVGLPFGQDRHSRVVAVQTLGRENVSLNPPEERCQRGAAAPHLVGQGRQAEE